MFVTGVQDVCSSDLPLPTPTVTRSQNDSRGSADLHSDRSDPPFHCVDTQKSNNVISPFRSNFNLILTPFFGSFLDTETVEGFTGHKPQVVLPV